MVSPHLDLASASLLISSCVPSSIINSFGEIIDGWLLELHSKVKQHSSSYYPVVFHWFKCVAIEVHGILVIRSFYDERYIHAKDLYE